MQQPDHVVHDGRHGTVLGLRIPLGHRDGDLLMVAEDDLRHGVAAVVDDGVVQPAKCGSRVERGILDLIRLHQVDDNIRPVLGPGTARCERHPIDRLDVATVAHCCFLPVSGVAPGCAPLRRRSSSRVNVRIRVRSQLASGASVAAAAATSRQVEGFTVLAIITTPPGPRPVRTPTGSSVTALTWASSATMTRTAWLYDATSRADAAAIPPPSANNAPRAGSRSNPATSNPASRRWRAMGRPIRPRPITPTRWIAFDAAFIPWRFLPWGPVAADLARPAWRSSRRPATRQ